VAKGTMKYLSKGYNIKIKDNSSSEIVNVKFPQKIAIKPTDFIGIKPKLEVEIGDTIKSGDAIAHHKYNPLIKITVPVGGKILNIVRGQRRVITEIEIGTDRNTEKKQFKIPKKLQQQNILNILLESGQFLFFKQRPFNTICNPDILPRDIFISGMDTAPLAADENILIDNDDYFQKGLTVLSHLTSGQVHLSTKPEKKKLFDKFQDITLHQFDGPHPAGNVGVHIHHISPILNRDDVVWTCNIKGVMQIGKLFTKSTLDPEILVKVSGNESNNKYFRTVMGADVSSFLTASKNSRIISGNVLTGTKIENNGYLGFFDSLISIIPEAKQPEFIGWIKPGFSKESKSKTLASSFNPFKKFYKPDTRYHGSQRTFVSSGNYENVLPMDIYPVFLMKAILAKDIEEMESLGIYELVEEDIALCEYICPSKIEWQDILSQGLALIEKEG